MSGLDHSTPSVSSKKRKIRFKPCDYVTSKRVKRNGSPGQSETEAEEDDEECEENTSTDQEIDWSKVEENLDRTAMKANLSARNVKSILHHILSDRAVIDYATNLAEKKEPEDIITQAKLTRSKAKQLGHEALILGPPEEKKISILDVEFSDSSDEEYCPSEHSQASDEDMSVLSDFIENQCSPFSSLQQASTPSSQIATNNDNDDDSSSQIGRQTSKARETVFTEVLEDNEPEIIALRTRSRAPMPDIEVEEIEAMFQPPDAEHLDQTSATNDDPDPEDVIWKQWLTDLTKPLKSLNDTADEASDEDFNYMEAAEENDPELEHEELRNDKATRVSQKELQEMFNELLLGYENISDFNYQMSPSFLFSSQDSQQDTLPSNQDIERDVSSLEITDSDRNRIRAQMQQHVQLLTQSYLLTCAHTEYEDVSSSSKQYIEELAMFDNRSKEINNVQQTSHSTSIFCTPGIETAARIIKSLEGKSIETKIPRDKKVTEYPISSSISHILASESYFNTYKELIPLSGVTIPNKTLKKKQSEAQRVSKFLPFEDNLLALGLRQFTGKKRYENISEHLLPTKSASQLKTRVRNVCNQGLRNNPIYQYVKADMEALFPLTFSVNTPRDLACQSIVEEPATAWKNSPVPSWLVPIRKRLMLEQCCVGKLEGYVSPHIFKKPSKESENQRKEPVLLNQGENFIKQFTCGNVSIKQLPIPVINISYQPVISIVQPNVDGKPDTQLQAITLPPFMHPLSAPMQGSVQQFAKTNTVAGFEKKKRRKRRKKCDIIKPLEFKEVSPSPSQTSDRIETMQRIESMQNTFSPQNDSSQDTLYSPMNTESPVHRNQPAQMSPIKQNQPAQMSPIKQNQPAQMSPIKQNQPPQMSPIKQNQPAQTIPILNTESHKAYIEQTVDSNTVNKSLNDIEHVSSKTEVLLNQAPQDITVSLLQNLPRLNPMDDLTMTSPSKPLHNLSFNDVKDIFKTPQKDGSESTVTPKKTATREESILVTPKTTPMKVANCTEHKESNRYDSHSSTKSINKNQHSVCLDLNSQWDEIKVSSLTDHENDMKERKLTSLDYVMNDSSNSDTSINKSAVVVSNNSLSNVNSTSKTQNSNCMGKQGEIKYTNDILTSSGSLVLSETHLSTKSDLSQDISTLTSVNSFNQAVSALTSVNSITQPSSTMISTDLFTQPSSTLISTNLFTQASSTLTAINSSGSNMNSSTSSDDIGLSNTFYSTTKANLSNIFSIPQTTPISFSEISNSSLISTASSTPSSQQTLSQVKSLTLIDSRTSIASKSIDSRTSLAMARLQPIATLQSLLTLVPNDVHVQSSFDNNYGSSEFANNPREMQFLQNNTIAKHSSCNPPTLNDSQGRDIYSVANTFKINPVENLSSSIPNNSFPVDTQNIHQNSFSNLGTNVTPNVSAYKTDVHMYKVCNINTISSQSPLVFTNTMMSPSTSAIARCVQPTVSSPEARCIVTSSICQRNDIVPTVKLENIEPETVSENKGNIYVLENIEPETVSENKGNIHVMENIEPETVSEHKGNIYVISDYEREQLSSASTNANETSSKQRIKNISLKDTVKRLKSDVLCDAEDTPKRKMKRRKTKKKCSPRKFDFAQKQKEKAEQFAESYLLRAQEILAHHPETFEKLINNMGSCSSRLEAFYRVEEILHDFPELVDTFAGFLEQHEARHVGKFLEWLNIDLVMTFQLSCQEFFYDKPGVYNTIKEKIIDVSQRTDDSNTIFKEISPLLQGSQDLLNKFVRLFPDLPPPPCYDEDFEVIDYAALVSGTKELDDFEEIPYQISSEQDNATTGCSYGKQKNKVTSTDVTCLSKQKSSVNIMANKLKLLASKRKKTVKNSTKNFSSEYNEIDEVSEESLIGYSSENVTENLSDRKHEKNNVGLEKVKDFMPELKLEAENSLLNLSSQTNKMIDMCSKERKLSDVEQNEKFPHVNTEEKNKLPSIQLDYGKDFLSNKTENIEDSQNSVEKKSKVSYDDISSQQSHVMSSLSFIDVLPLGVLQESQPRSHKVTKDNLSEIDSRTKSPNKLSKDGCIQSPSNKVDKVDVTSNKVKEFDEIDKHNFIKWENIARVTKAGENIEAVTTNDESIARVTRNHENIETVTTNDENIETVTTNDENIARVAKADENIETIARNDENTCRSEMSDIDFKISPPDKPEVIEIISNSSMVATRNENSVDRSMISDSFVACVPISLSNIENIQISTPAKITDNDNSAIHINTSIPLKTETDLQSLSFGNLSQIHQACKAESNNDRTSKQIVKQYQHKESSNNSPPANTFKGKIKRRLCKSELITLETEVSSELFENSNSFDISLFPNTFASLQQRFDECSRQVEKQLDIKNNETFSEKKPEFAELKPFNKTNVNVTFNEQSELTFPEFPLSSNNTKHEVVSSFTPQREVTSSSNTKLDADDVLDGKAVHGHADHSICAIQTYKNPSEEGSNSRKYYISKINETTAHAQSGSNTCSVDYDTSHTNHNPWQEMEERIILKHLQEHLDCTFACIKLQECLPTERTLKQIREKIDEMLLRYSCTESSSENEDEELS